MGMDKAAWLPEPTDWTDTVQAKPEVSEPSCDSQADNPATDPLEHLQWAQSLPMPCKTSSNPLTDKQIQNLQHMANDPTGYQQEVVKKLHKWAERKKQLYTASAQYKQTLDEVQKVTLGSIVVLLLEVLIDVTGLVDRSHVKDLMRGFPVTGSIAAGTCGVPIQGASTPNLV